MNLCSSSAWNILMASNADDLSRGIYIHTHSTRDFRQAGHEHHVAGNDNYKAGAGRERSIGHIKGPPSGRAHELGIIGERILGFGNTDRQFAKPPIGKLLQL